MNISTQNIDVHISESQEGVATSEEIDSRIQIYRKESVEQEEKVPQHAEESNQMMYDVHYDSSRQSESKPE